MKSKDVDFVFLGEREYIQAGTISNTLRDVIDEWEIGSIKKINANFHKIIKTNGRFELLDDSLMEQVSVKDFPAIFRLETETGVYRIVLKATDGEPGSVLYNESDLIAASHLEEPKKSATIELSSFKQFFYIVIALNKRLLNKILPNEGYGRWIVARYTLDWERLNIVPMSCLKLNLVSSIGGVSSKTLISVDDMPVGFIYFTRERK